ncbi:alpha/beta fold hydrolase [Ramlibacter sp.]|uniref:alpha/beta fold hydrolase n=1 Tax=Ramlibacter sp. TaxID=1917967 RepID=UPI002625BCAF|nr:alpha/beta hydrolase [Ramlibacter sp.]
MSALEPQPLQLLIPGTLCDPRLFAPMLEQWPTGGAPAEGARVLDLSELDEAEAWWQRQLPGLPDPLDLVGFSLGGVLALALLRLAPQRVRRLSLVAASALGGTPAHESRVAAQIAQWRAQGPAAVARQMTEQAVPAQGRTPALTQCLEAMAEATSESAFLAQARLNATRPDGLKTLVRWGGPLLLLCGEQDPWCGPATQAQTLAHRPDAHCITLPGAGHYLPLERPAAVAAALAPFFRTDTP